MTTAKAPASPSPLDRALTALSRANAKLTAVERSRAEPIAIVGAACRFPGGAVDLDGFLRVLDGGLDAVRRVPDERWPEQSTERVPGARFAALLDSIDGFDAAFFGISPREAQHLDPQQRLLLELAWEGLEDAGIGPLSVAGSNTGVYLGISQAEYAERFLAAGAASGAGTAEPHIITGNATSVAAGRIAYVLGLQGPCMAVDTACSSSLVAVHLACQSLRSGETSLALACGVNIVLSLSSTLTMGLTGALSPDGRCKTFDARANGYVRGEGCGLVVLKRLSDALRDGDRIRALIRGSAVNQDGRSTGLTAPNVIAQKAVLRRALASANIAAPEVGYIETHGTGTPLGDPIELEAVCDVYGAPRAEEARCLVGAVKSNLGHLEAASGMAGLLKVVLALESERIPQTIHLRSVNPMIRLEGTSLSLAREASPWPRSVAPRIAGVSAFGISGTNSHVLVQEAPLREASSSSDTADTADIAEGSHLLVVSARSPQALTDLARAFVGILRDPARGSLRDVCFSAATRRSPLEYRLAVAGVDRADVLQRLQSFVDGERSEVVLSKSGSRRPRVAFVFPGQGGEWDAMGRELLRDEQVFRASIERTDAALGALCNGLSVATLLAEGVGQARPFNTAMMQPVSFALQVGLLDLWRARGVTPDAVVGHSFGEIAAAYAAGILDLEDACRVVAARTSSVQQLAGTGAMASVELDVDGLRAYLRSREGRVFVAGVVSPTSTTLGGAPSAIDELIETLTKDGIQAKRVRRVDFASHTALVEPVLPELERTLEVLKPRQSSVLFLSTVEARFLSGTQLDGSYWRKNLRQSVRFLEAFDALLADGFDTFVEIGPHPILLPPMDTTLQLRDATATLVPSLRRAEPERAALLRSLGTLFARGLDVEWKGVFSEASRYVPLPCYPWQRARYWIEPTRGGEVLRGPRTFAAADDEAKLYVAMAVDRSTTPYLFEHEVAGVAILPAAAYASLLIEVGRALHPRGAIVIEELRFLLPLALVDAGANLQAVATREAGGVAVVKLLARSRTGAEGWTCHATAKVRVEDTDGPTWDRSEAMRRCPGETSGAAFYEAIEALGFAFGPSLRGIEKLHLGEAEVVAEIAPREAIEAQLAEHAFHTAMLDPCLQALLGLALRVDAGTLSFQPGVSASVVSEIESLRFDASPSGKLFVHLHADVAAETTEVLVADEAGRVLIHIRGIRSSRSASLSSADPALARLAFRLVWQASAIGTTKADRGLSIVVLRDPSCDYGVVSALRKDGAVHVVPWLDGENEPAAYEALSRAIESAGANASVVYVAADEPPSAACAAFAAVVKVVSTTDVRLVLGTRGAQSERNAQPTMAALWGLAEIIRTEHPRLGCRSVDTEDREDLGEAIRAELSADGHEPRVLVRNGARHVARLARGFGRRRREPHAVRPDATYLVTGGLSGLGLATAEWLAAAGAGRLVLAGRSAPSAETELTLAQIRERGTAVDVVACNVARRDDVVTLFERLRHDALPLAGVVHSAAAFGGGTVVDTTRAGFDDLLAAKAEGAAHLDALTRDMPLDFFVLYGSLASTLGLAGSAAYAAANAYLEGLARCRRHAGLPAVVVAWGTWNDVGMAARIGTRDWEVANERRGLQRLSSEHALAALEIIALSVDTDVVAITPLDVAAWRAWVTGMRAEPLFDALVRGKDNSPTSVRAALAAASSADERTRLIAAQVRIQLARVLHTSPDDLDDDSPFSALGLDSILGVELRNRLEAAFELRLSAAIILKSPSIAALIPALEAALEASSSSPTSSPS